METDRITDLTKLESFVNGLYAKNDIPENIKLDITLRLNNKEHENLVFKLNTKDRLNLSLKYYENIPKISQFQTLYGVVHVEIIPDFEEVQKELKTLISRGEEIPSELLERYNTLKETLKTEANGSN